MIRITEIHEIQAEDGTCLKAKLDYPDCDHIGALVLFCHGSGPNTYDNRRIIDGIEFSYFDILASEFCDRGMGLCRLNVRGCSVSEEPPLFTSIDPEKYRSNLPLNTISDIVHTIEYLKQLETFRDAKILLLGASEGATLAPFIAERSRRVDALLLIGFSYSNMKDTLKWQLSGGSSMVNIRRWFDYDKKGYVTLADYEEDRYGIRPVVFPRTSFSDLDLTDDGVLDERDFEIGLKDYRTRVFEAIEQDDDDWLKENYAVHLTARWFKEHFALPRVSNPLSSLDIPVFVFRGEADANIPASDFIDLENERDRFVGSTLEVLTFPHHDHDLNFLDQVLSHRWPEGWEAVFDTAERFA